MNRNRREQQGKASCPKPPMEVYVIQEMIIHRPLSTHLLVHLRGRDMNPAVAYKHVTCGCVKSARLALQ